VLDMLDGRYPSKEFGELRARIVWDRVAGTIRARSGSRQLAVANAGTIPDRGLYTVTLPDGRIVMAQLPTSLATQFQAGGAVRVSVRPDPVPVAPPDSAAVLDDSPA